MHYLSYIFILMDTGQGQGLFVKYFVLKILSKLTKNGYSYDYVDKWRDLHP